jgi:prepilin-type N-terminal cleavage/methylation domain-containing protein
MSGHPCPPAFTLLEVLVALVILATGLLGLSANAALVWRLVGDGSRLTIAATLATARFEQIRALPCASSSSGTAITRGIEERWTVAPMGPPPPRALEVEIAVTYRLRSNQSGAQRTQRFRGAVPCGPG